MKQIHFLWIFTGLVASSIFYTFSCTSRIAIGGINPGFHLLVKRWYMILRHRHQFIECGTDEAGRGCLAGPVTAASVILPDAFEAGLINDSKLLSHKMRDGLREIILKNAVAYGIAHVFPEVIDTINILNASLKTMHLAIDQLSTRPQHILVDGNRFKTYLNRTHDCMIKGDGRFLSIAAASILAKTERDRYMENLGEEFPEYGWHQNKGYPTKAHRRAIQVHGITPHHRKSFRLLPERYSLDL